MISENYETKSGRLAADYMKGYVLEENTNKLRCHDYYELILLERGRSTYSSNDGVVKVGDKTLILTKAREVHNPYTDSSTLYERYKILFYSDFINEVFGEKISISDYITASYKKPLEDSDFDELKVYFKRVFELLKSGNKEDNLSLGIFLVCILLRGAECQSRFNIKENNYICDVVEYIKQNYDKHLTIENIAAHFFVSRGKLIYDFKDYANMSIQGYITVTRIEAAKELLSLGYSVVSVAERCGFSSSSYFIKVFSGVTDMTPLKFQMKFYRK